MTLQKVFKEKIQEDANKILAKKKDLIFLPTNLPNTCEAIIITNGNLRIGMPLDPPLNKIVRQQFIDAGFEVSEFKLDDYGFMQNAKARLKLINENGDYERTVIFDLACFDHSEGATCKFEVVGELTETKKVYEVICKEGAEEKAFA